MAATQKRKRKVPPRRASRSLLARRPALPAFDPEPHHVDIIGLGLVAFGVFLAGVAWLHWGGGSLGSGAVHGMRLLLGQLGYALPVALVVGGGLVLARELAPPVRPLRTGTICLLAAITLMLAAGTLGIGPGAAAPGRLWQGSSLEARG